MGVPKFYRWLSERYPLCSQSANDPFLPPLDNLYLDMNGLIHPCTHPDDEDTKLVRSIEMMYNAIFDYIDRIVRTVQPKKVLFLAVDGVAPRAKLNQQRARRFQSVKNKERIIAEAMDRGEELPQDVCLYLLFLFLYCFLHIIIAYYNYY